MIQSRIYIGSPGLYAISDAELINVTILGVKREGRGQNVIADDPDADAVLVPGYRGCAYLPGSGRLRFADPFNSPDEPDFVVDIFPFLERVWVLFKT